MTAPYVWTYSDAFDAMVDYLSGVIGASQPMIFRAIQTAYRDLPGLHDWSFLEATGRIQVQAAQTTGTVVYDHTGGAVEKSLTLTGATFPSDAVDWNIYLNTPDVVCQIATRESDTVVTLDATMNPGADVAATSFTMYPRWYRLPTDFMGLGQAMEDTSWSLGMYVSPQEMDRLERYEHQTGDIRFYTIRAVPDLLGAMGLFVQPPSDATETHDISYKRRPRQIRYSGHDATDHAGTITVTSGSATLTGSGTAFSSSHIGSVVRIGTSTTELPTGLEGTSPYGEQRTILAVAGTGSATLDANVSTNRTAVKYRITDPIDLDVSVWDLFLRRAEVALANARRMENRSAAYAEFQEALRRAKRSDFRPRQRRVAGSSRRPVSRLANAPTPTTNW